MVDGNLVAAVSYGTYRRCGTYRVQRYVPLTFRPGPMLFSHINQRHLFPVSIQDNQQFYYQLICQAHFYFFCLPFYKCQKLLEMDNNDEAKRLKKNQAKRDRYKLRSKCKNNILLISTSEDSSSEDSDERRC